MVPDGRLELPDPLSEPELAIERQQESQINLLEDFPAEDAAEDDDLNQITETEEPAGEHDTDLLADGSSSFGSSFDGFSDLDPLESLQSFANPETSLLKNIVGYTALFFAAANGNDLVVEALLATNKVDIRQVDAFGK